MVTLRINAQEIKQMARAAFPIHAAVYMPILKWRQGEYQGLTRLHPSIKDRVVPLFEIPTEAWDFETESPAKTLDEHLAPFGQRLETKWEDRLCLIDSPYVDDDATLADGTHHIAFAIGSAIEVGANPIPVTGLRRSRAYQQAIQTIVQRHRTPVAIRLSPEDFSADLPTNLANLLELLATSRRNCHLVLDVRAGIADSPDTQALIWITLLSQLPDVAEWSGVTVAGTAFPAELSAAYFRPQGRVTRGEWAAYQTLLTRRGPQIRIPSFGDYGVSHPDTEAIDPRLIDPTAKIKYTTPNDWIVFVGQQVKRYGRGQYQGLALAVTQSSDYAGSTYSWGDEYIYECAHNGGSTGGTSTWPSVGTNHHVSLVVNQLASFHGV